MLPTARADKLLVQELPDETLVYDLKSNKAHCLNPTAALVWRHCDGKTNLSALAKIVRLQTSEVLKTSEVWSGSADEEILWAALLQLDKARLLRDPVVPPASVKRFSRREWARRMGAAAILAPVVLSITAPTAAAGNSTCAGQHAPCAGYICPAGLSCHSTGPANCGCLA